MLPRSLRISLPTFSTRTSWMLLCACATMPRRLVFGVDALLRIVGLGQHVRDRVRAAEHVLVDRERDVDAAGFLAHVVVVDELHVELRADADDGRGGVRRR